MKIDHKTKTLKYLDVYPKLPVNAPIGYPHIIDLNSLNSDTYSSQGISIADVVVTVLFKFMPGALSAFLDMDRPSFIFIQDGNSGSLDFCIKRDRRVVTVGYLKQQQFGGWDHLHRYLINGKSTEEWNPILYRSGDSYVETDAKDILAKAPTFAYSILMHEPWRADLPDQPIEVVCGLSYGRSL